MQRGHDGVKKLNRLTRIARCRHGRQPRHQTHPCRLTKCLECQLSAVRALERIIFAAIPQRNFDQPDNRGVPSARHRGNPRPAPSPDTQKGTPPKRRPLDDPVTWQWRM